MLKAADPLLLEQLCARLGGLQWRHRLCGSAQPCEGTTGTTRASHRQAAGYRLLVDTLWLLTLPPLPSQEQGSGLNRTLKRHAHHAHFAVNFGGGWTAVDELQRAVAALTHAELAASVLLVMDIDCEQEAAAIGAALSSLSLHQLVYTGAVPGVFPQSLRQLAVVDTFVDHCTRCGDVYELLEVALASQQHSQQLLRALQPLAQLRELRLNQHLLLLTAAGVRNLAAWCPSLQRLALNLSPFEGLSHDLHALTTLLGVQIRLVFNARGYTAAGVSALLRLLPGSLKLRSLELTADTLTPADEDCLAQVTLTTLILLLADPAARLQRELPGVKVVYRPA